MSHVSLDLIKSMKSLNDNDYLGKQLRHLYMRYILITEYFMIADASELNFFLTHLLTLLIQHRPEDYTGFAVQYFQKVRSYHHILNADYNFVSSTNYNRRAFTYVVLQSLSSFNDSSEILSTDFTQLIQTICNDFDVKIISNASSTAAFFHNSATSYTFMSLKISFLFHFLFEQWLSKIEKLFQDESALNNLNVNRVINRLEEFNRSLPISIAQPTLNTINKVMTAHKNVMSTNDITFIQLKRAFVTSDVIQKEIYRVPSSVKPFVLP